MINIKVISDTICPWCYIGKKELEKAINKLNNIEFSISYKPFQLDPTMPVNGVDRKSYINRKFGEDTAKEVGNKIKEAGKLVGIDFNYEKIVRTPNTLNSHRILKWAEKDQLGHKRSVLRRAPQSLHRAGPKSGAHTQADLDPGVPYLSAAFQVVQRQRGCAPADDF